MMLMQLGTVTFEVWPLNIDEYDRDSGYDYVRKDVMSGRRPAESMGEGDETMALAGRLFPDHFGGLSSLEELDALKSSGSAQMVVRGDGKPLGWFTIDRIRERNTVLGSKGVGRIISFEVALTRCEKPSPESYLSTLMRIFLG